jgi:phosphoglycerate dehydrogenase-like enzyme
LLREPWLLRIVAEVKAVIYQPINKTWKEQLAELEKEFPEVIFVAGMPEAESHLADADVLISATPTQEIVGRAQKVKLIIVPITGVDHLPLEEIADRGIRLANAHGNARYVAERSVALILAYFGRIVEFHNDLVEREKWHGFWVRQGIGDSWSTIHGKTVSIIGAGEIGGHAARYLKAFDTTVVGYRRTRTADLPEHYDDMVYDLDEAIEKGDIVLIALPSTPETLGLFGPERLQRMEGKLLVNVGRGDIVDEKALYEGLQSGAPAGAAIDTWWNYPAGGATTGAPSRFPIHQLPNVVASPHLAGFVDRAVTASICQACENLRRFLSGRELLTEVDPKRGY